LHPHFRFRPRLLLDIDGTLAESLPHWLQLAASLTNGRVDLRPEDVRHYDMPSNRDRKGEALTEAEWRKVVSEFAIERAAQVLPVAGAIEAVLRLAAKFDIVFATSRPRSGHGPTLDWLDHYFADLPREVHFVQGGGKHLVGRLFAAVEDDYEQALRFASLGVQCWVRELPYTEGELEKPNRYIKRWSNWAALADCLFEELARMDLVEVR